MLSIAKEHVIILSVDNQSMRNQLEENDIFFIDFPKIGTKIFDDPMFKEIQDESLLEKFHNAGFEDNTHRGNNNWFRESFISARNKWLVESMKHNKDNEVNEYLQEIYGDADIVYIDEYYDNRPGMRLVRNILKSSADIDNQKISVCDLACGHGAMLKSLKEIGASCYGIEKSAARVEKLMEEGIVCRQGDVIHSPFEDCFFDVVICMECLEHVKNPFDVAKEIYRVLKPEGQVFVSVPLGNAHESVNHVRQFDRDRLSNVFFETGFSKIKIIEIPYTNNDLNLNLFLSGIKN